MSVADDLQEAIAGSVDAYDRLVVTIKDSSPFTGTVYVITEAQLVAMQASYHRMAEIARLAA